MVELYDLVDDLQYNSENCYAHQLSEVLDSTYKVIRVPLAALNQVVIPAGSLVLSRLRLRTLSKELARVQEATYGTKLFIYEQDTWENFLVDSPYWGSYRRINDALKPVSFLNMSHWWANLVRSTGIPARFVQVWMLPRYCQPFIPWDKREHNVIFCGTVYPRRAEFFVQLKERGIRVEVVPVQKNYESYLNLLSNSKIVIRCDKIDWLIDAGQGTQRITEYNALWQRDVECAARGCFSMRELDKEAALWNIDRIPTIVPFTSLDEAVDNIHRVLAMDSSITNSLITKSIEVVKSSEGWMSVPRVITEALEGR